MSICARRFLFFFFWWPAEEEKLENKCVGMQRELFDTKRLLGGRDATQTEVLVERNATQVSLNSG